LDVARQPLAELLALAHVSAEQAQALVHLASARLNTARVLLRTAEDTRSAVQAIHDLMKYFRKSTGSLVKTPF
jgi:LytS/YehU family sensor histidine kinase